AADKTYEGSIRLGFATDTYDAEGRQIGDAKPGEVSLEEIQAIAKEMEGEINQIPPKFSAKKIGGVPAYKLARKEHEVELRPVRVQVRRFEIHNLDGDLARFTAQVSAGTYVRSLAHDLGQKLGIGAHLARLRRTNSGEFSLDHAVSLERLAEIKEKAGSDEAQWAGIAIHPRNLLHGLPSITVNDEVAALISNGRAVNLPEFSAAQQVKVFLGRDRLICIAGRIAGTLFQPRVVLLTQ